MALRKLLQVFVYLYTLVILQLYMLFANTHINGQGLMIISISLVVLSNT